MSRMIENNELLEAMNKRIKEMKQAPYLANLNNATMEAFEVTILMDISRSLAVIADSMTKEEEEDDK